MHGGVNGNGFTYMDNYASGPQGHIDGGHIMGQHMNQAFMYTHHQQHQIGFNQNGGGAFLAPSETESDAHSHQRFQGQDQ